MSLTHRDMLIAGRMQVLYANAEREMMAKVERRLARGITDVGWNERKLLETTLMRQEIERELVRLGASVDKEARSMLSLAYWRSVQRVEAQLGGTAVALGTPSHAMLALQRSFAEGLQGTHVAILRQFDDVYRRVVAEAAAEGVAGVSARRGVARRILGDFQRRGVTGFRDRAGRSWTLRSYAEMASRTAVAHAHVQGSIDRLLSRNIRLGRIPAAISERACELCLPWEGRIVSLAGRVDATPYTLDDARSAGLFHPNCRHGVVAYIPELEEAKKHDIAQDQPVPATKPVAKPPKAPRKTLVNPGAAKPPPSSLKTEKELKDYLQKELGVKRVNLRSPDFDYTLHPDLYDKVAQGMHAAIGRFPRRVRTQMVQEIRLADVGEYVKKWPTAGVNSPIAWAGGQTISLAPEYHSAFAGLQARLVQTELHGLTTGFHADGYGLTAQRYWAGQNTMIHETGHLVDNYYALSRGYTKQGTDLLRSWEASGGLKNAVSGYGQKNAQEMFAETYTAMVTKEPANWGPHEKALDKFLRSKYAEGAERVVAPQPTITFG